MRGRPHPFDPDDPRPVIHLRWPLWGRRPLAALMLCLSAALGLVAYRGLSFSALQPPPTLRAASKAPPTVPNEPRDVNPFPANGTTIIDPPPGVMRDAPLIIETADTGAEASSWLVVLYDGVTGRFVAGAFLRPGTIMTLLLPAGAYQIALAGGSSWYGQSDLFGPGTRAWRSKRPLLLATSPSPPAHLTLRSAAALNPPFVPMPPAELHMPSFRSRQEGSHAR